jgi:hypothetical protein
MYFLMTGDYATRRLHGWVSLATGDAEGPALEAVWAQHGASLIADAERYGFQPFGFTKAKPRGAGVERWRLEFLRVHAY